MTVGESEALKKGTSVFWRGDPAVTGIITDTSSDEVTISWNNGQVDIVQHTGMREIQRTPTKPSGAQRD
ncbi:MAG: hypothetical protein WB760_15595 [Xanthobacteraceae bacterium]